MAKCAFCEQPALADGYTGPPMCDEHVVIAQAVATMRREWGWTDITPQQVQTYLQFNLLMPFDLEKVPELCATMPEFGESVSQRVGESASQRVGESASQRISGGTR